MLRSVKELLECRVMTESGSVGRVRDLFFDDESGKITFMVAGKSSAGEDESIMVPLPVVKGTDLDNRRITLPGALEWFLTRRLSG